MVKVIYRVHQSAYSQEQAGALGLTWEPPVEKVGYIHLYPAREKYRIEGELVHWSDIRGYFTDGSGYF